MTGKLYIHQLVVTMYVCVCFPFPSVGGELDRYVHTHRIYSSNDSDLNAITIPSFQNLCLQKSIALLSAKVYSCLYLPVSCESLKVPG